MPAPHRAGRSGTSQTTWAHARVRPIRASGTLRHTRVPYETGPSNGCRSRERGREPDMATSSAGTTRARPIPRPGRRRRGGRRTRAGPARRGPLAVPADRRPALRPGDHRRGLPAVLGRGGRAGRHLRGPRDRAARARRGAARVRRRLRLHHPGRRGLRPVRADVSAAGLDGAVALWPGAGQHDRRQPDPRRRRVGARRAARRVPAAPRRRRRRAGRRRRRRRTSRATRRR